MTGFIRPIGLSDEEARQNLETRLLIIASHHEQGDMGGGIVTGYCNECAWAWPCPTHLMAIGETSLVDPWDKDGDDAIVHNDNDWYDDDHDRAGG